MVFLKHTFKITYLFLTKTGKIQNKARLNKKTIEILLNELFTLNDQQNEKVN